MVVWQTKAVEIAPGVFKVGSIEHPALQESSGLTSSPSRPGVFWSHNDTGSPTFLFALDQTGRHLGGYEVQGANLIDWEAITSYDGFLYFADTGTNGMFRTHSAIHKVREPDLQKTWGPAEVVESWFVRFPGEREDCESMFILNNYCYLIGKYPSRGTVPLFRFSLLDSAESILLAKVTDIPISSPVSDAALSEDHNRLGLVTEDGVTVIFIEGNPALAASALRRSIRFKNDSIEGATFINTGLLTSAEADPDLLLFKDPLIEGLPVFTDPLTDLTGFVGSTVQLDAVATGFPPPTYQWRFNGTVLAAQTNASLTLSNLTLANAGSYEVTAINSAGSAVSSATLQVLEKVVDLRITEVMSSENPNPLSTADWWELTSFEPEVVDLSGWRFNDSIGGLSDAYVLPAGIFIRPGESIVLVEDLTADEFIAWWGRTNLPPDVQIITYAGSALSFRALGDSVRLWAPSAEDDNALAARVDFGEATQGVTFSYDPETQQFGAKSQVGVNGAFRAASGGDVGSPGRIRGTELRLMVKADQSEESLTIALPVGSSEEYVLEYSSDFKTWQLAPEQLEENSNGVQIEPGLNAVRFFRLRHK